jgi:resuscitation-promoting factor RpfA
MLVLLPYVAAVLLRPDTDAATRSEQRPALHAAHDWSGVAECESDADWSIDTGNGFYGGLQFTETSWLAEGGAEFASRPALASAPEQIAVAERLLADQGPQAWPYCSRYLRSAA